MIQSKSGEISKNSSTKRKQLNSLLALMLYVSQFVNEKVYI